MLCEKIYKSETARKLVDRFCVHLQDAEKKTTEMRPKKLSAILIFPITPNTT